VKQTIERQGYIEGVIDDLNTLVDKYYTETVKEESDAFRFRVSHINISSLWPAHEKTLIFYMNIKPGEFMSKIHEILKEEHLSEIGEKIKIHSTFGNARYYYYLNRSNNVWVKISYNGRLFCNTLIHAVCDTCPTIQKA
jgi:hypothetical protein